jgi:hypothetical protein
MLETLLIMSISERKDRGLQIFEICRCCPARVGTDGGSPPERVKVSMTGWMIRNLRRAK